MAMPGKIEITFQLFALVPAAMFSVIIQVLVKLVKRENLKATV